MKKLKVKLTAFFLTVCLLLTLCANTASAATSVINLGFEQYLSDFEASTYPEYFGMDSDYEIITGSVGSDKEKGDIYEGTASLVRTGSPYLRNTMLLGKAHPLTVGHYYRVQMRMKLNSYAQLNGAVKLLFNSATNMPWAPVSCTDSNNMGDYLNDYYAVAAINGLLSGNWETKTFVIYASAPYLALQTPGYVNMAFDNFTFTDLGTSGTADAPAEYTEYTQYIMDEPEYLLAGEETNILGFEHYPYSLSGTSLVTSAYEGSRALRVTVNGKAKLKALKEGETYKLTFYAKTTEETVFGFYNENYKDVPQTIAVPSTNGVWQKVTGYISSLENGYIYITNLGTATAFADNITFTLQNMSLENGGISVLTDEAEEIEGSQAIRYYFGYYGTPTSIDFNETLYKITERGIIVKTEDNEVLTFKKDEGLKNVWNENNGNITFSYYLKGFKKEEAAKLSIHGYVKINDGKQDIVFYCKGSNHSVVTAKHKFNIINSGDSNFNVNGTNIRSYTLIFPRSRSYLVTLAGENIVNAFKKAGINLSIAYDDQTKRTYPILIGNTSYSQSNITSDLDGLGNDAYVIKVNSKALVINGNSDLAIYAASEKLANDISEYYGAGVGIGFKANAVYTSGNYTPSSSTYALAFSDEFDGDSINQDVWGDHWNYSISWAKGKNGMGGNDYDCNPENNASVVIAGTGQVVKPIEVKNGELTLSAGRMSQKTYTSGGVTYTSQCGEYDTFGCHIAMEDKMAYKYGMLEVRLKIGTDKLYTSIWSNGDPSKTLFPQCKRTGYVEYDLTESFGYGDYAAATIHRWWDAGYTDYRHNSTGYNSPDGHGDWNENFVSGSRKSSYIGQNGTFYDYHLYSLCWTPEKVAIAYDGNVVSKLKFTEHTNTSIFNLFSELVLSACPSSSYGTSNAPLMQSTFDYVRIYQIADRGDTVLFGN